MLIDDANRARLADFGFAGVSIPPGASGSSDVGGTAGYMAPELLVHQRNKKNKDQSSISPLKVPVDVYALGMLMYEVQSRITYDNDESSIL